jgi:hypothetical protein
MIIALVIYYINTHQAAAIQQPVEFATVITVDYELTAPVAPQARNTLYVG